MAVPVRRQPPRSHRIQRQHQLAHSILGGGDLGRSHLREVLTLQNLAVGHAQPRLFLVLLALLALGVGSWTAALNVKYRDVGHALPFLIQLWMFATPSVYMDLNAPEAAGAAGGFVSTLLALNPMTGIIEAFRWALLGRGEPPVAALGGSVVLVAVLLVTGLLYFRRMERTFADVI